MEPDGFLFQKRHMSAPSGGNEPDLDRLMTRRER